MSPVVGWTLAVLAIAVGYLGWGWPGVVLGVTVIVFWLLLQFSRAMRVMRSAGQRPVGQVDSAVMLQSRLARGMTMLQILPLTKSLGERLSTDPERWAWRDPAGHAVHTEWKRGRLDTWELHRASGDQPPSPVSAPVAVGASEPSTPAA